jgi:hypothetical protein
MNPFEKLKVEKRDDVNPIGRILAIVVALVAAMLVSAILIKLANASPLQRSVRE